MLQSKRRTTTIHEAAGAEGLSPRREAPRIVGHEKERRHLEVTFASNPAPRQSAGRGHRGASMAPMMPRSNIKIRRLVCPNRQATTSKGRWGTLPGEVKEGIGPKGQGGTRVRKSPPPSPLSDPAGTPPTHSGNAQAALT